MAPTEDAAQRRSAAARRARGGATAPRRVPELPAAQLPARAGQRPHARAPVWLEVGGERDEGLRRGERVAVSLVRAVRRQRQRRGERGQLAPARVPLAALDAEHAPQQRGVHVAPRRAGRQRAQLRAQEGALDPGRVRHRHAAGQRGGERGQRLGGERRRVEVRLAQAVDLHRLRRRRGQWPHEARHGARGEHAPTLHRQRRERDHLVALGIEAGGLHVHHEEARGAPGAARPSAQRAANPSFSPTPRCTAATPRNALLSDVRVSECSAFGSIRSSGAMPARSCST